MRVIAVLGSRSGKTTLVTHLAGLLAARGRRVVLVDTDHRTQELAVWARDLPRVGSNVTMLVGYGLRACRLRRRLQACSEETALVDTPSIGRAAKLAALAAADTSLVLFRPDEEGRRLVYQEVEPLVNQLENEEGRRLDVRLLMNGFDGVVGPAQAELLRRLPWPVMASQIGIHPGMHSFCAPSLDTGGLPEQRTGIRSICSLAVELGLAAVP